MDGCYNCPNLDVGAPSAPAMLRLPFILSRLPQRPLLLLPRGAGGALAAQRRPRAPCALINIFARRAHAEEYVAVEVADGASVAELKRAVLAELALRVTPDRVRLRREDAGGGAGAPLDSRGTLAGQQVAAGASVVVEVLRDECSARPAHHPPPLSSHVLVSVGAAASPSHVLVSVGAAASPVRLAYAPGTDVYQLKAAIIAEFKLEAAPAHVRLLLKAAGGGEPVPLDRSEQLRQCVLEGSCVVVEVTMHSECNDCAAVAPGCASFFDSTHSRELRLDTNQSRATHPVQPLSSLSQCLGSTPEWSSSRPLPALQSLGPFCCKAASSPW